MRAGTHTYKNTDLHSYVIYNTCHILYKITTARFNCMIGIRLHSKTCTLLAMTPYLQLHPANMTLRCSRREQLHFYKSNINTTKLTLTIYCFLFMGCLVNLNAFFASLFASGQNQGMHFFLMTPFRNIASSL